MDDSSLHCRDPKKHQQKWQIHHSFSNQNHNPALHGKEEPTFCLACGVLTLEDPYQLLVKKRLVLRTVYEILNIKPLDFIRILPEEEPVTLHVLSIILEITNNSTDENSRSLAAECLLLLLCHQKSEKLGLATMHRLTTLIQEERNFQRSVVKFQIISKLLEIHPLLSRMFHQDEGQFLHYLIGGLTYPSDAVKLSVVNIFYRTYKSTSPKNSTHYIHLQVAKCIIPLLNSTQDEEVLLSALGLQLHLMKDAAETLPIFLESKTGNATFISVAKNFLLSKSAELQICTAQCICIISQHQLMESYMNSLMECNIPELLFELLGTTNEILLESILCCIRCFAEYSAFFTKCHAMYGTESIIRSTCNLVNARNWRLTTISLNLLEVLFSSDVSTAIDGIVFQVAIKLLNNLLKVNDPLILSATSKFLSAFLRKNNLPWPLPLSVLLSTMEAYFASVAKFLRISTASINSQLSTLEFNPNKCSLEEKILHHSFEVLKATSKLSHEFSSHPVTMEEAFTCPILEKENEENCTSSEKKRSHEVLLELSLTSLDKIFIPCTLNLKIRTSIGQTACAHLISTLSELYEHHWKSSPYLLEITQKIFCCGLLKCFFGFTNLIDFPLQRYIDIGEMKEKIAACVFYMLWSMIHEEPHVDEVYLKAIKIGIKELNDRIENCTTLLSEQCTFENPSQDLFNTTSAQLTLLCLNYVSFRCGYGVVSAQVLLPHLVCFALRNSELPDIPCIALKQMVYLLAVCSYDVFHKGGSFPTGFLEASRILLAVISKLPSFSGIYTRDKLVLWWCFLQENKSDFALFVFNDWLSTNTMALDEEKQFFLQLLAKNEHVQEIFMDCFQNQDAKVAKRASLYLRHMLRNEILVNIDSPVLNGFKLMLERLTLQIPKILVNICLAIHEGSSSNDEKISILLECLLWCRHLFGEGFQSEMELKLVFHITNFASTKQLADYTTLTSCFNYLGSVICTKLPSYDHRAWHIISGHIKLMALVEKCIMDENNVDLQQTALSLLENVVGYQIRNAVQINSGVTQIKISVVQIFKWLEASTCMQMLTYSLLNHVIKSNFQNMVVRIITSVDPFFDSNGNGRLFLSRSDFRQLYSYLQNAVLMGGSMKSVALSCLMNVIDYVSRRDPELEKHLMLQPCNRIMLEDRLSSGHISDVYTRMLIEKWLTYTERSPFLITVIQQFAQKLCDFPNKKDICTVVTKLCNGSYGSIINDSIKKHLHNETDLHTLQLECGMRNTTLFDNVEKLVQTCIGQPQDATPKDSKKVKNARKQKKVKARKHTNT